jgi:hypothetical protein
MPSLCSCGLAFLFINTGTNLKSITMAEEKNFADGFVFKRNENAPDFVVGKLSVKVDEAIAWLKSNTKNGWVNVDVKRSKGGNYYMELDTWESKKATPTTNKTTTEVDSIEESGLPF